MQNQLCWILISDIVTTFFPQKKYFS